MSTISTIEANTHKLIWELKKIDSIDNFKLDHIYNFYFIKLQSNLHFSNVLKLEILKESNLSKQIEKNFSFLFVWTNSQRKVSKSLEKAKLALLRDLPKYLDKILKIVNKEFKNDNK